MAGVAQRGSGRSLTGWGRTTPSRARVVGPLPVEQLRALVTARPPGGVLARGAGRSYGDAAQNAGGVVVHPVTVPRVHVHPDTATVQVSASTSFTDLLTRIVPEGLLLPVLPGTRHLTVVGAVAADVHGKNQRSDGSLGRWITEIGILDGTGEVRRLTPDGDPEWFRATVGGLGLTGVILGATIRLLRIRSPRMLVSTRRMADLDALLTAMDGAMDRYCVAWIDTTATGRSLGRGIVEVGDHLADPDPAAAGGGLAAFFHRLDALCGGNRTLGPRGFIEYQCVVPEGAHGVIRQILEAAQRHRCATFLGTLRRFGPESGGHLSYPRLAQWRAAASRLDPAGVFCSDLGQRLGLGRAGATSPGRKHAG